MSVNSRLQKIEEAEAKVNMKFCTTPQVKRLAEGESIFKVLDWDDDLNPIYELDEPWKPKSKQ